MDIWGILKIEPTKDTEALKKAYRKQLVTVHPEDDPEGFQALRAAYEEALRLSSLPDEAGKEEEAAEDTTPRGELERAMQRLYASFFRRVLVSEWDELLSTPYATSIDTSEEAMITVLDFISEHFRVPHQVFKYLSERYNLSDRREELLERYPFRYLDYIQANAIYADAVDYTLFRGPEDYDYDGLLDVIAEFSRANKNGDLETQKKLYPKLTNLPVTNPDVSAMLCRYQWQTGDREGAEAKLRELEAEYPEVLSVMITLGDMLQHTERVDEAEQCYLRAEKLGGSSQMIRGRLAEIMIRRGQFEKARDTFFDLLQESPYDGYFRTEVLQACEGIISFKSGKLKETPEDMKLRTELAAAYYQSYRFEEAIAVLTEVERPEDPILRATYYNYLGRSLLSIHKTEEALPALRSWSEAIAQIPGEDTSEAAIAVRKRNGYALTLIGVAYMQKKDYDTARQYIESALGMKHEEILVTMEEHCVLEYLSGNDPMGIEACKELELRSPQNFQASNIRAKCCCRLGLMQDAMEYAERAAGIYPYIAEPYYTMAKCLLKMKAFREVEAVAARYKEINPDSDTVRLIRALLLQEQEDTDKADTTVSSLLLPVLPHLEEGVSDIEEPDELYRLLGDDFAARGRAAEALDYYKKAIEVNEQSPVLFNRIAALYKRLARYEEALECYRLQEALAADNRAFLNEAFCLMQMGREGQARDAVLRAVESSPADNLNLVISARMLMDLHYAKDALDVLDLVSEDPADAKDSLEVRVCRIRALIQMKRYDEAESFLHQVPIKDVQFKDLQLQLVELLISVGRFARAEEVIRSMQWREGELSRQYDLLCRSRFHAGDLEGLEKLIRESEIWDKRGKECSTAYQYELLGRLLLLKRRFREAEQVFLNASNRKPNQRYRYLGYMAECASRQFSGRGRMQRYVASLERTQITGTDACESKIRLAQGRRAEKSYEEAHRILEEVFGMLTVNGEINRTVSEAYEELGWLYMAEKRNGEALLAFQKAEDTRGFDVPLRDVIKRLKNDSRN